MANEIQFSATVQANKGGASVNKSGSCTLNMAGSQMVQATQSIGTGTWTAISLGSLAGVPAKLMIINLDPTNYVQLAGDNAGAQLQDQLEPGGDFAVRSPVATIYAKAHTAACLIAVTAMDA